LSSGISRTIDVGRKPLDDYVFDIIISFQEGIDHIVIKGFGDYISKAVDIYNELRHRLGEGIVLEKIEIGSERRRGRLRSFIAIHVKRKY